MTDQNLQHGSGKNPNEENWLSCKNSRRKLVDIGFLKGKWLNTLHTKIKSDKGCKADEDLARLLIKRYYWRHKRRSRRRTHIHGSHRVIVLQNDVWTQWRELKCSLQVNSNSQLATMLINAWHDRAAYIQTFCIAQNADQQSAVNVIDVKQPNKQDQPDTSFTSGPLIKITTDTPHHIVETKCNFVESEVDSYSGSDTPHHIVEAKCNFVESEVDSYSDSDNDDLMSYFQTEKKIIKISDDITEKGEKFGSRRKSSRVQSRGYRPDYASLDWKDDTDDMEDGFVYKNMRKNVVKETEVRVRHKSATDLTDDEFADNIKDKRISKRKVIEDPDFIVSDIENTKDFSESDEYSETDENVKTCTQENEDKCSSDIEKMAKCQKIRKSRIGKPLGINCKRKRSKKEDDEWYQLEKKPKSKKETRRKASSELQVDKKSWIHIKLEDHQEKYRMEFVGSFARKNRNVNMIEELFTCLMCGRFKSTAKDIFESHIEKHVNKVLECDQCTYVGRSEIEVVKHKMSSGHRSKGHQYMCDICGQVLYTWDSRLSHMGKEHDNPQFQCRYCDEKFVTRAKRQLHQRTVHSDQVKYCFNCETDYGSLNLDDFRDHQSSCKVAHQCQVCGVILASKSGLSNHIKSIHMNVRTYQCSTCPYAAKSAQRLREHEMTHKSVHPYSCDRCTFTCVQAYQLKSHMRTHSGEKPYKCLQCKFAAAWNVQLKEHTKIHGMENTVVCLKCDIVFRNQKALRMHEKRDHPQFPVT